MDKMVERHDGLQSVLAAVRQHIGVMIEGFIVKGRRWPHPVDKSWLNPAPFNPQAEGVQAEFASVDTSYSQARAAKVPAGIPVTLLTATVDETMPAEALKLWIEKHKQWLATVPGSKHIVVEKATHFIQAQQPALVIDAIRQVSKPR